MANNLSYVNRPQREIMIGEIQIGDYADIAYENNDTIYDHAIYDRAIYGHSIYGHAIYGHAIYRRYIIKIKPAKITLGKSNAWDEKIKLIKVDKGISDNLLGNTLNDFWQIKDCPAVHRITFSKNATATKYFERDFTQGPTKIILIQNSKYKEYYDTDFTELKNGIILYQLEESNVLALVDPSAAIYNITSEDIKFLPENKIVHSAGIFSTLKSSFFNDYAVLNLMNYSNNFKKNSLDNFKKNSLDNFNEIFLFECEKGLIVKLNLNDSSSSEYYKDSLFDSIYPLKHKKLLCFLKNGNVYILNLVTKEKIEIDIPDIDKSIAKYFMNPNQFVNGDIILCGIGDKYLYDYYRISIRDGSSEKIGIFDHTNLIVILPNDNILLLNRCLTTIQLWNPITKELTDILTIDKINDIDINLILKGLVLQNGDTLIYISTSQHYYLYQHKTREIVILSALENEYTRVKGLLRFKQLQNGNLIINNGSHLGIVEFPHSQKEIDTRSYDEINFSIMLPPDIKNLIRNYL